ncbi:MAG TPA: hypothetical protein PK295_00675 [Candidatus Magasanikbacteria bacterium]|nr:hypothetical protein [Candidatus Magasanikbacteria bacterium]
MKKTLKNKPKIKPDALIPKETVGGLRAYERVVGELSEIYSKQKPFIEQVEQIARVARPAVLALNKRAEQIQAIQKMIQDADQRHEAVVSVRHLQSTHDLSDDAVERLSEKMAEQVLQKIKREGSRKKDKKITIYLGDDHVLYRNPKKQNHCKLEGEIQVGILKNLSGLKDEFTSTGRICRMVGSKSEESIRKAIGIINRKGRIDLHIKDRIIESVRGSGYRLNKKYRIQFS